MTRETKVGIVVSCSFLGLLGVVVTSKLRGELSPEKAESPAQAAAVTPKPKERSKIEPAKAAATKRQSINLGNGGRRKNALVKAPGKDKASAPSTVPLPPGPSEDLSPAPATKEKTTDKPAPEAPSSPMPAGKDPEAAPLPAPSPTEPSSPAPAAPGAENVSPPSASPAVDAVTPAEVLAAFLPFSAASNTAAEETPDNEKKKAILTKQKEKAVGSTPEAVPLPPAAPGTEPANTEGTPPAAVPEKATEPKTVVPVPSASTDSTPPPPPAGDPVETGPKATIPPAPLPAEKEGSKPQPGDTLKLVSPPVKLPPGGGEGQEPAPPARPDKRAAAPAVIAPVVARTTATPPSKVEVFSVEEYAVKPGDTFASISKAKYGSDKYAEALRLFIVNDSLLSDAGRDAAGNLQRGQTISIPDLVILERRYGHVIQGLPPGGALAPAAETSRKTTFEVRPVVDVPIRPGAAPTYPIRQEGVTMREVAAKALGNGDRWNEILRLNKDYNPERALPVGAVLKLPADARVPMPVPVVP